jgi:hypothetical protein
MIKLTKLLKEIVSGPKAIIMAGGAGVGKTFVYNKFKDLTKDWLLLNPDKYARNPESPLYKNLYQASKETESELTSALSQQDKPNIIWDTTATNPQSVLRIPESGYNTLMAMVYAHPMVAYYQNFKRAKESGEESIFGRAILDTWAKAYNPELINTYKNAFGDNFVLINNTGGAPQELIDGFNEAAKNGPDSIKQYIDDITKRDSEFYTVTQKKEPIILPKEVETDFNEKIKSLGSINSYEERKLKEKALEYYNKNNSFMPLKKQGRSNGFEENLASIRKTIEKSKEEEKEIYNKLFNIFQNALDITLSPDEAIDKIKQFINS